MLASLIPTTPRLANQPKATRFLFSRLLSSASSSSTLRLVPLPKSSLMEPVDPTPKVSAVKLGDQDRPKVGELTPRNINTEKYVVKLYGRSGLRFTSGEELLQHYVNILTKVVGSEEDAKKKMYFASPRWTALSFGAEIDKETAKKLEGLKGVEVEEDFHYEVRKKVVELFAWDFIPVNWNNRLDDMFRYRESFPRGLVGDFCHWLIHIKKPVGMSYAQQYVEYCINLLSEFVKSEKEAKAKIYIVWCNEPYGFAAELEDQQAARKLLESPKVEHVLEDHCYDDITDNYPRKCLVVFPDHGDDGIRQIREWDLRDD